MTNSRQGRNFEIKSLATMPILLKLMPIVFLVCAPAWAQSGSAPSQGSDSKPEATQSPETAPDPNKQASPDQTSAAPPADSTKLEPIKIEKAAYPWEAQEKQLQGQVWVKILVSEAGDVENVEVISGDPVLAKSAVDAAKKWKFKPFIKSGKPVPVSTKLPFNFAFSENIHAEKAPTDSSTEVKRVRVSLGVSQGLLVYRVQPVYPYAARRAGIQGTVVLRAVIDKGGRIADLQMISGPKELAPAAIGAVQQWRYKPYLLKGDPVEVDTEIRVNFTLSSR
jgi:TonB family protein